VACQLDLSGCGLTGLPAGLGALSCQLLLLAAPVG
jgi:hypothetical protein